MITKEDFCKRIKSIQDFDTEIRDIATSISKAFKNSTYDMMPEIGVAMQESVKELLASNFSCPKDAIYNIDYFLYENVDDKAVYITQEDGKRYDLSTAENLYDYLVKFYKKNNC
jgi:hypothetical protein